MSTRRPATLQSLAILVPLGLGLKYYPGPGHQWLNDSAAGIAYVVFWCLALFAIWPRRAAIVPIVFTVCAATAFLEYLQHVDPAWLRPARSTWLGRILLGTTFDRSDLLYYAIGGVIGWAWLTGLARLKGGTDGDVPNR